VYKKEREKWVDFRGRGGGGRQKKATSFSTKQ